MIFFILLLLPFYLVRFSVFGFKTNVLDILLMLLAIYSLFNFRSSLFTNIKIKKLLLPIALIIVGVSLATINSEDIFRSLGILKSYFILPVLFFFAAANIIKTDKQKEWALKAWFGGGFIVALIGIFYWLIGELTYDGRLQAFFESPNQLAMFLAPTFIIGIYFIAAKNSFAVHASAGITVMIGTVIFLTKSLGAVLAIFIALLFYLYKKPSKKNVAIAVISVIIIILFFISANKQIFSERSSLSSRVMIWQSAGAILKDNWLQGIGPSTFQNKYLEYQKYFPPYLEWSSPQPHNIFLAFWLQTGLVGFIGFLWLIFIFFKNVWNNKNDNVFFLAGILMIYTLMHGLIDTTYWKNDLAIMFWAIILLSQSLEPTESSAQKD